MFVLSRFQAPVYADKVNVDLVLKLNSNWTATEKSEIQLNWICVWSLQRPRSSTTEARPMFIHRIEPNNFVSTR